MSNLARVKSRLNTGDQYELYDVSSQEIVQIDAPLQFVDDFIGGGHTAGVPAAGAPSAGYPWVKKIVGAAPPTVALVNNGAGGQMAMALTATSEKEDAALYWNDNLSIDVTKGAVWQARAQLTTLPTLLAQATMGLHSAWIDGPDNAAEYIHFAAAGNGTILMQAYDGTNTYSISTGLTVANTDWHIYRIDCTVLTDIKFFIDGNQVSANGAVAFGATGANAVLQAYASMYKASGAGLGQLTLDAIDITNFRT